MALVANALVTVDEVKSYVNITTSIDNLEDTLEDLINRVTDWFHRTCGVEQFEAKNYTEYYNGTGTNELMVDQRPINSISILADDIDWQWTSDTYFDSDDYAILDDMIVLKDEIFTEGIRNIKITYNAGYSTIPDILKQACIDEVVNLYNRREDLDLLTKTYADGGSITRSTDPMLPRTRDILKRFMGVGIY